MSSTEISSLLACNPPAFSRCGEIYCSDNLESFFINCAICSQQFNLLSGNLFITHIKECKTVGFPSQCDQSTTTQEISRYTIDSLLKDALKHNNIGGDENTEVQNDPLMSLKLEMAKENEEPKGNTSEHPEDELEYLSDYKDEEELTIDKVIRRKKIEGIIDEYKKHPILWDVNLSAAASQAEKKQHYKQIRKIVNSKFKMNLTYNELYYQIHALRQVYRKVLKRKQSFEKFFTDGYTKFNPKLWYFEKLSFIQGSRNDIEIEDLDVDDADQDIITKREFSEPESSDSADEQPAKEKIRKIKERDSCKILSEPLIISDLIAQYKQYPFLWDQTASLYNSKYARKDAFRKITAHINKKFNKNVTDRDVRQQIVNLRSGYRRVQRKKHDADYRISLWYFDELSFIDRKANEEENSLIPVDAESSDTQLGENQNFSMFSYNSNQEEQDAESGETSSRKREQEIVLAIIEEYKEHPCLYNNYLYKTNCRFSRADAITEIRTTVNNKFNTTYNDMEIKGKIAQLRSSYRRILRTKEQFESLHANAKRKFHPQWKYYDKLAFIGTKDSDFSVRRIKNRRSRRRENEAKTKEAKATTAHQEKDEEEGEEEEDEDEEEDDEDMAAESLQHNDDIFPESNDESNSNMLDTEFLPEDDEKLIKIEQPSGDDEKDRQNPKSIVKNKELLTAVIEEYRKLPCLWAIQHYTNDNLYRRSAYKKMASNINAQFNTNYNYKDMSVEIVKLRSTYKRMLRKKQENPAYVSKLWYAEKLCFIEGKGKNTEIDKEGEALLNIDDNMLSQDHAVESEQDDMEEIFHKKAKIKTKDTVFEIIDLYKSSPILWDTKHPMHMLRTERRKAIQQILEILGRDHDCFLTVEEFRYQVRFLKDSYFRALRHEAAARMGDIGSSYIPKPFFFDRLSFLEPFAEKIPPSSTQSQMMMDTSEPTEDFTYLVENRSLMMDFIEVYKTQTCLWDPKNKDKNNLDALSNAYDKIITVFLQYNVTLTKNQVLNAIQFLNFSFLKHQKTKELKPTEKSPDEPLMWFYDQLVFLERIPKKTDKYCSHCDQHFHTLAAYEKHKIEIAGDYPYKCSICKAGFVSRSKYAYHQITHKEPHKCDQCGFQAYDKHNFNVHMRRHKGIHPFKCQECDKGFVTSTELNRHMRMHTGERPFICDICGKSLPANSEFRQHMKRHSNQRDHKCDLCGNAFFTPKTLRDHMASHSNERQHVCETCGAAFKRKKTLHQHKALHAEKKKHECKICGKLFAQKAGVYSHMKSHGLMVGN